MIRSVRTTPDSALMRGRLGMAYDVNRMRDVAMATYRQAEALDSDDFRWPYFRAHLIAEAAEHAEALEVLDKALAIDPEYAPAWLWRGSWLLKAGNPDDAMDAFSRAKDLGGGDEAQWSCSAGMTRRLKSCSP
ncbi:MAG: tetratricopeptide repeat protein [Pseudomonadales bacterium]|nr:tetratricopeptide repeat protein [Pseudomonadales bacterium]